MENEEKCPVVREIKGGYYLRDFPKGYYVIRALKQGGWHFYPEHDYEYPRHYDSKEEYENDVMAKAFRCDDDILVDEKEAEKYPVPKRF